MKTDDTIMAVSSASGSAPRMIVRASGPDALRLARALLDVDLPRQSTAKRVVMHVGNIRFPAWLYAYVAPNSYTGEDLVEFHLPGNPLLVRFAVQELTRLGARPADAGEFTARAYFNGRMDLTAAEGVAASIAASNELELSAARKLLAGELTRRLAPTTAALADALALIEVGIDFSDEQVTFISSDDLMNRIDAARATLDELLGHSARFERLSHEPTVVLVGKPNAGKSTLLNALAGNDRAVVSPVAGTTRDVLSAEVILRRGVVRVMDVAGLDAGWDATSPVDGQMRARALRAVEEADFVVLVRDGLDELQPLKLPREPDLSIRTKSDLDRDPAHGSLLQLSAHTGEGMDAFRQALDRLCFGHSAGAATLALNARHVHAIEEAREALSAANDLIPHGAEFVVQELRRALDALGSVSGRLSADDLLGRIFSAFCIGK